MRRTEGTVEWATTEKVAATGDPELLALAGTPAVVNALRDKYLRDREVRPFFASSLLSLQVLEGP